VIGTYFKYNGDLFDEVDIERVKELMNVVRTIGKMSCSMCYRDISFSSFKNGGKICEVIFYGDKYRYFLE